jgi:protein TonB
MAMRLWPSRSSQSLETADDRFVGTRFFILPPGMVPVPRTSPIPVRKRTPWHPKPDTDQNIDRTGGRDWFGSHLTLETERRHQPATYAMAGVVHATIALVLVAVPIWRGEPISIPRISQPFMVPVLLSLPTASKLFPPSMTPSASNPAVPPPPEPLQSTPAEKADLPMASPVLPVESPDGVKPESEAQAAGSPEGSVNGTPGGVAGGLVGGEVGGGGGQQATGPTAGAVRMGPGIERPIKIKDVKAVYPEGSLSGRLRGTVIIEATIGTDGRVYDAKVIRSIAGLDQAALDAVRQWVYEPARLNGVAIAVIMTVTVSFAII